MERRRSLKKDKKDSDRFRFHRDRHLGFSVSNEYYQNVPFFFTRESASLNLIGNYKGSSIFVICNGPSVASGIYDLSKLKLPGVMTYGINNGARTIRPNFWSCVDSPERFIKSVWLDPCITKFVPHAHAEKKIFDNEKWEQMDMVVGQCPNVIYFHRNEKFMANRFLFEDTINWGNHKEFGGGRSVMLPVLRICFLLGFRQVYLLGADFKMSEKYAYHFDEQREEGAVKCNNDTYDRLKDEYLKELKPYFDEQGFNVYNCNRDSNLKVFPYKNFDEAIAETTSKLGDVSNERTWGMYCKPGEKDKNKEEVPDDQKLNLKSLVKRKPVYDCQIQTQERQPEKIEETEKVVDRTEKKLEAMLERLIDKKLEGVLKNKQNEEPPFHQIKLPSASQVKKEIKNIQESGFVRHLPCGNICEGSSNNMDIK